MSSRFFPHKVILTDAVLSLDEDSVLSTNEVSLSKLSHWHLVLYSNQFVLWFLDMVKPMVLAAKVQFRTLGSNQIHRKTTRCFLKYAQDLTCGHGTDRYPTVHFTSASRASSNDKVRTNSGHSSVYSRSWQVRVGVVWIGDPALAVFLLGISFVEFTGLNRNNGDLWLPTTDKNLLLVGSFPLNLKESWWLALLWFGNRQSVHTLPLIKGETHTAAEPEMSVRYGVNGGFLIHLVTYQC